jgi:hypothetical protein
MAWIQERTHKSGTAFAVRFRIGSRQSTVTFEDEASAEKFRALVNTVGPKRALEVSGGDTVKATPNRETVGEYLDASPA